MQHLLARARWDADGVSDDLRSYVTEHLGDPDGMLAVDETGDPSDASSLRAAATASQVAANGAY
jgi:SRSO17 transposase